MTLKMVTVVDTRLIAVPTSTSNDSGERDTEMHQAKKGIRWHSGIKARIGVGVDSGLVHTVIRIAANVHAVMQGNTLLHGEESVVFADAGYQGVDKREDTKSVYWHVAMPAGKRRALNKISQWGNLLGNAEQIKASVRANVEHPVRALKCQFGYIKDRYRSSAKDTSRLMMLFALNNLWMFRGILLNGADA